MAATEKHPPDKSERKFYKYHPKKPVTVVICIICENVYHRSDFEKIKNHKYVGERLIICPEHNVKDITSHSSEHMLNDVAKKTIAIIKMAN